MNAHDSGRRGEDSAASFLCGKGFHIVSKNARRGHLEIDIIAKDETHIIFAEVKTRRSIPNTAHPFGRPASAVDAAKASRLCNAVGDWLRSNTDSWTGLVPRIDVIEVYISPQTDKYKVLKIVHMENAVHY